MGLVSNVLSQDSVPLPRTVFVTLRWDQLTTCLIPDQILNSVEPRARGHACPPHSLLANACCVAGASPRKDRTALDYHRQHLLLLNIPPEQRSALCIWYRVEEHLIKPKCHHGATLTRIKTLSQAST